MIPVTIALRNFMCYRDDASATAPLALDLDGIHVACLSGENGAGKSALLDAITWALWGEARMSDDELIAQGESEMEVDLTFALGSQPYRVIRKRLAGKTGPRGGKVGGKSSLDLQIRNGAGWKTLSENTLAETQERIDELLHMRYKTFINASFLLQGRADEFTRKSPAERKEVLADILDLDEYAELEQKAKNRAKIYENEARGLGGKIEQLREQASRHDYWQSEVALVEQAIAALGEQLHTAQAEQEKASNELRALQGKAEQRKELLRRLGELRERQARQEQELTTLRTQLAQAEALLARREEIVAGLAQLQTARNEQARLDALRPRYDELRDQYSDLKSALKDEQRRIESQHDGARREVERLEAQVARKPALEASLRNLQQQLAALAPLAEELAALRNESEALDTRIDRANELLRQGAALRNQIEKRQDSLVAVREEQQRTLQRLQRDMQDAPRWRTDLASAQQAAQQAQSLALQVAEQRGREQFLADRTGELRARCTTLKQQAEQLKKDQGRLREIAGDSEIGRLGDYRETMPISQSPNLQSPISNLSCPLCRSELGFDNAQHVLAHYDEEIEALREAYRVANNEAKTGDAELTTLRKELASASAALEQAQQAAARLEHLQQQVEKAALWQQELDQARFKLESVEQQIGAKTFAAEEQRELSEIEEEIKRLGDLGNLTTRRDALRQRSRELDGRLAARTELGGEAEALRRTVLELEQAGAKLPAAAAEANQLAATLAAEQYAPELRSRLAAVKAEGEALGYNQSVYDATTAQIRELGCWEGEERKLREAEIRHEGDSKLLAQAIEARNSRANEIELLARDDALLEAELQALPRATMRSNEAHAVVQRLQKELSVKQNDLGQKQGYLHTAQIALQQLTDAEAQLHHTQERQGLFAELAEAYGKKGVQAMLIEAAIPQIEDEANRLLGRMTDGQMHVALKTQKDTKKGDTVETLEIEIADALGTRTYDAFSGGEALRANFAIRIALSRLLARRAGARLETLVIDEGFGVLDAVGRERMVEAITEVQNDFQRIMVITHIDELKERFPVQIEVIKGPKGSRWEVR
jgi:DNA repair protein SbcC/Rad50